MDSVRDSVPIQIAWVKISASYVEDTFLHTRYTSLCTSDSTRYTSLRTNDFKHGHIPRNTRDTAFNSLQRGYRGMEAHLCTSQVMSSARSLSRALRCCQKHEYRYLDVHMLRYVCEIRAWPMDNTRRRRTMHDQKRPSSCF